MKKTFVTKTLRNAKGEVITWDPCYPFHLMLKSKPGRKAKRKFCYPVWNEDGSLMKLVF